MNTKKNFYILSIYTNDFEKEEVYRINEGLQIYDRILQLSELNFFMANLTEYQDQKASFSIDINFSIDGTFDVMSETINGCKQPLSSTHHLLSYFKDIKRHFVIIENNSQKPPVKPKRSIFGGKKSSDNIYDNTIDLLN